MLWDGKVIEMLTINRDNRVDKITRLVLLFFAVFFAVFSVYGSTASAKDKKAPAPYSHEEIREFEKTHEPVQKGSILYEMEDEIIKANPDKLQWYDEKTHRGLKPVYAEYGMDTASSFSSPYHNHIRLTSSGSFQACPVPMSGQDFTMTPSVYYWSCIAYGMGHEMIHQIYSQKRKTSWSAKREERRATFLGAELLENTRDYSFASVMADVWLTNSDNVHPSFGEVEKFVINKIETDSNGRIKIVCRETPKIEYGNKYWYAFYIDGKPMTAWENHPFSEIDEHAVELRNFYVAGQIATCIKKGIFKKGYVRYTYENKYFYNEYKGNIAVTCFDNPEGKGEPVKIIGVFCTPMNTPKEKREHFELDEDKVINSILDASRREC